MNTITVNTQNNQPVLFTEIKVGGGKVKINFLTMPNEKLTHSIKKMLLDSLSSTIRTA